MTPTRRLLRVRAIAALAAGGVCALATAALVAGSLDLIEHLVSMGAGAFVVALACLVGRSGAGVFRLTMRWRTPVSTDAPALLLYRDAVVRAAGVFTAAAIGGGLALLAASALGNRAFGTRFEGWLLPGQVLLAVVVGATLAALLLTLQGRLARWRTQGRVDGLAVTDSLEAAASLLSLLAVGTLLTLALAAVAGELMGNLVSTIGGALVVLLFSSFLALPTYLAVRLLGSRWLRDAAAPRTRWLVLPRVDDEATQALAQQLRQHWSAGPTVVVTPPEARVGGELLVVADRLRLRAPLFPTNPGQFDDWLDLLPPAERWWGLPLREWHPPTSLMRAAVARHLQPEDSLVLFTAQPDDVLAWQDLARNRTHRLRWLGADPAPASAFDDREPAAAAASSLDTRTAEATAAPAPAPSPPVPGAAAGATPSAAAELAPEPLPARRQRLQAALDALDARAVGPDDAERVHLESELGLVLYALDQLPAARALQEHVLAVRERTLDRHDRAIDRALVDLLETLFEMEAYSEALPLTERALALRSELLGPQHPDTLHTLDNRSAVLWGLGRFDEALRDSEAAFAGRSEVLGVDHPETLNTWNNLLHIRAALGRVDEALEGRRRQLERCLAALGPAHPYTLSALDGLGLLLMAQQRPDEARDAFERCLDGRRLTLGPQHTRTLLTQRSLGQALRALGRSADGDRLIRQAWEAAVQTHGSDSALARELASSLEAASEAKSGAASDESTPGAPVPEAPAAVISGVQVSEATGGETAALEARLRAEFDDARKAAAGPTVPRDDIEALGDAAERLAALLASRGEQPVDLWQTAWGTRRSLMAHDDDADLWISGLEAATALAAALQAIDKRNEARTRLEEAWSMAERRTPPVTSTEHAEAIVMQVQLKVALQLADLASSDPPALTRLRQSLVDLARMAASDPTDHVSAGIIDAAIAAVTERIEAAGRRAAS